MNTIPCGDCEHFHQRQKGSSQGLKPITSFGWCSIQSVFSVNDPQRPDGARTTADPQSKPVIVQPGKIIPTCTLVRRA